MLELYTRLQQLVAPLVFFMIVGIMISHHEPWSGVVLMAGIGAFISGIPVAQWLWARRKVRLEGERLRVALGAEGRFANDRYELRKNGIVVTFTIPPQSKTSLVTATGASPHLALAVTHETALTSQNVARGRAIDIDLGDPVIDPLLAIEGAPVEAVRATLTDDRVHFPLRGVAGETSLDLTARDGVIRVRCTGHADNEPLVRLAFALVEASRDHARTPREGDAAWERLHEIQDARDERTQRLKAWMSQAIAAIVALGCALKVTSATNMKMNLGPAEIGGLILSSFGVPHYRGDILATVAICWIGFTIPAVVHYAQLGHGRLQTGVSPAASFLLAPVILIGLFVTYDAERKNPSASRTPFSSAAAPAPAITRVIHDSEGRAFDVQCPASAVTVSTCTVTGASADVAPQSLASAAGDPAFSLSRSRLLTVCDGRHKGSATSWGVGACRPIACSTADDCAAPARDKTPTTCVNGYCQAASVPLTSTDVTALCMAGAGPAIQGPEVARRIALGKKACTGTCTSPPGCVQP